MVNIKNVSLQLFENGWFFFDRGKVCTMKYIIYERIARKMKKALHLHVYLWLMGKIMNILTFIQTYRLPFLLVKNKLKKK